MVRPYLRRKCRGENGNPISLYTLSLSRPPDALSVTVGTHRWCVDGIII